MQISRGTAQDISDAASAVNPANALAKKKEDAEYVSMDTARLKLSVPEIPGYYLYWHLGRNVPAALQHRYTFVDREEVEVSEFGIANDRSANGSTDLGTRISVGAGISGDKDGVAEDRLYLMKLPMALHELGMQQKTARNEEIAAQIRAGHSPGPGGESQRDSDANKRYMKEGQHLFYPKGAKR